MSQYHDTGLRSTVNLESHQVVTPTWNSTIHQMLEFQVIESPDAIALTYNSESLTYHELNQKANQLAHYLRQQGVMTDTPVGIFVERSFDMVIGILAVLKAGGAYVPLDVTYPIERLSYMFQDSQAKILLTQSHLAERLNVAHLPICLDTDWGTIAQYSSDNPNYLVSPEDLAYVIYTSGSTGRPKGIAMPHRPLINLLQWQLKDFEFPQARTLQFTPISFDVAFQEIFSTLCSGGTLVLIAESTRRNAEALLSYLGNEQIERLFLPFIALQHLAEAARSNPTVHFSLREVVTAGEQLKVTRSLIQWFSQLNDCKLYNHYGPSESHVVTSYTLAGAPQTWPHLPPIGRPIDNVQIYIVDSTLRRENDLLKLLPEGEVGELVIGGVALARGYLNQPQLMQGKFVANPFSPLLGEQLYRTGDIARLRSDGTIEFLGRVDDQVKIRGVRVELAEIEAHLSQHPRVEGTAVVAREDAYNNKRLAAYIVSAGGDTPEQQNQLAFELRTFLQNRLQNCLIPSSFTFVQALPLTPSGKVDRRALPVPSSNRPALDVEFTAPINELERRLATIWSQVLEIQVVGVQDNFFDLGGDSLKAIQLIHRVREIFSVQLPVEALFEAPTIQCLAKLVNLASQQGSQDDSRLLAELAADTVLDPAINLPPTDSFQPTPSKHILITGVTGFLGAFLLDELLKQTPAHIYCLVRTRSTSQGNQEIEQNLKRYLLWHESYRTRITAIAGDLAEPSLGLTAALFDQLAETVDAIYHNAAFINLIYPYAKLRAANVLGTQELLKLATRSRIKPFHFVSTMDVFQTSQAFSTEFLLEDQRLNPAAAIHFDGYTKSKWVSEQLVTTARSHGLPASIYRPAMVAGHSVTGAGNPGDLMSRLIRCFIQLGYAPSFDMTVNIAPVDFFSRAAIYLSLQPDSLGKSFNLINPHPISLNQLVEQINECGYLVKQIGPADWEALLIQKIGSLDTISSVLTSKSVATQPSYIERSSVNARNVSCQNALDGLATTSIVCPPTDKHLLSTYFSYFIKVGFLDAPVSCNLLQDYANLIK